jgi:DNA topoisomerase-1
MNEALMEKARARHIYTVAEIARSEPQRLAKTLDLAPDAAQKLKTEAEGVLEKLRRRSECRKFMRNHLIPRKGRSYSKIMATLKESGVTDLAALAKTNSAILQKAGIGETEAHDLLAEARITHNGQILKEIGIPAVSLKKYLAAGILSPEEFCTIAPDTLSSRTGMSAATVNRHIGLVCEYLHRPIPGGKTGPATKTAVKKAAPKKKSVRKELLILKGMTGSVAEALAKAGIIRADDLITADPADLATRSGADRTLIANFQKQLKKKREIIQI